LLALVVLLSAAVLVLVVSLAVPVSVSLPLCTSAVAVAEAEAEVEAVTPTEAVNPAQNDGVAVSVPSYKGQPGTVVLGGARPPPQSRSSQISAVSASYQITSGVGSETLVEVQPPRSVLAVAVTARRRRPPTAVRRDRASRAIVV
jgi:hypothetical protein